jgi:ribulose-5-phosphate 4-epimerase/fuculose-1-phosphate aldolase
MSDEGVIKFRLDHRPERLDPRRHGAAACQLIAWRELLALTGLVGQEPGRYGGFGYGNLSVRTGPPGAPRGRRSFLVTGTQTSGRRDLGLADLAVVERYDLAEHRLWCYGGTRPSSESLTHAAFYDLGPHIRCVLHAHSPVLWERKQELRLPTTTPEAGYGTAEMVREVQRLYRSSPLEERRILAMGGHQDGIVVFGRSLEEAGSTLLAWLARAYQATCAAALRVE